MPGKQTLMIAGGEGGIIELEGNWVPDPEIEAAVMMRVANYLEDVEAPLFSAREIAVADTKERFAREIDPDDIPWAELSESYLAWKQSRGYGTPDILQLTSQAGNPRSMAYSAPTGWEVVGDTLVYDTSVLPGYAFAHQSGEGKPGQTLPKREFVGLSNNAIEEIAAEFEAWFAATGAVFDAPIIGLGFGSNKLGTFPIISTFLGQPILRTPRGPRFGFK